MNKKYLLVLFALVCSGVASAQTTLFSENFNGASPAFTLNTSDLSSGSATNLWLVNNSYTGGSSSITCFGFPFTFTIGNTTTQPAGIAGNPTSNYMHISSAAGTASGITNANYLAADGFCNFDEYNFSKMSTDISTSGMNTTTLRFWWMCGGEAGANYGEVYYSTDAGASWTLVTTPISQYSGQTSWVQQTITNAAFDNQPTLRFGFRFVNETASSPIDPGFALDDVSISATSGGGCINTTSSFAATVCNSYTVPSGLATYTTSGTYNDTIPNAAGCDSVLTISLTVNQSTGNTISISSCGNYTVPSGDETYATTGTYNDTIPNAAGCDSILTINLTVNQSTSNTISISSCGNYTVPSGDETYTTTGTYNDTIPNAAGCDSILTINLTIDTISLATTLSPTGDTITAVEAGALYQWLDCANGNAIISGANAQSYRPSIPGNYSVIITKGSCTDTSGCVSVLLIGLPVAKSALALPLYPNPTKGLFTIELAAGAQVLISNTLGQLLLDKNIDAGKQELSLQEMPQGIYFITIVQQTSKQSYKLVKE